MKSVKLRIVSGLIAASMAVLAGCSGAGTGTTTAGTSAGTGAGTGTGAATEIKIAVAAPMTGDNSEYGIGFANAAELMAKQWNEANASSGKKVTIVRYDDKNSPEEAVSVANKIVSEKDTAMVLGHFSSGVAMAAAPIYEQNKIVEISPSASHPDYSGIGDYIFRNNTVISTEAKASLDIAVNDFGKSKIGVISIKTDWGVSTSGIVKQLVESDFPGATVVAHEEVIEGSDDYSPAISKLNEAGAEVVIAVGQYNLLAPVATQYKQVNPDIQLVGFSNAYSQQLLELGGQAVEGLGFPVIFFSQSDDPKVKEFVDAYKAAYGSDPSALTAQAYDSVGIFIQAAAKVGTEDREALKNEIASLTYEGVTGTTKFDQIGDVQKDFTKVVIKNGAFELLTK